MKKVFALVAVCGFALAFAACGKKAEEAASTEDTTKVEVAPVVADTTGADTTATDTTAAH